MEILKLPTEAFNVVTLQDKFKNGLLRDHFDAIYYINEYYFETRSGMYLFYDVLLEQFEFYDPKEFNRCVKKKVENHKDIEKYYDTNNRIYNIVCKIDKPRHFKIGNEYYVNECFGLLHKTFLPYDEYDEEIKNGVNIMCNYYKEVYCSNDEELFIAFMKYLSQVVQGKKTEVLIYNKSIQGAGKSTGTDFMMEYVIGKKASLISNTEPLLTNYNKILMGKIWVVFEELPTFTASQWAGVSSKIKTYTTEKTAMFRDLYEKAIAADNLFNGVINSNVEAIKDSDGRRIVIMPISTKRKGDYAYYKTIRDTCFNMRIGEAFYSYLLTLDVSNFYGQRDFPVTTNKINAISNLLCPTFKYLKSFVLSNTQVGRINCKEFYSNFVQFCKENNLNITQKNDFHKRLEEIGYTPKKSGTFYYEILIDDLKIIAKKNNWIGEYDEEDSNDNKGENGSLVQEGKYTDEYVNSLKSEIERLQSVVSTLSKQQPTIFIKKTKAQEAPQPI